MRRFFPWTLLFVGLAGCSGDSASRPKAAGEAPPNENFKAHEIEGTDTDGKPIKLSDLKGKVVVVDFWATWCPPCMALIPHEKELVRRLQGKPFALLGVSADHTLEDLKEVQASNKLPWPSVWDESGDIQRRWKVRYLPTAFVIDHEGTVRYSFVGPEIEENLEAAVEALLKKVPAKN